MSFEFRPPDQPPEGMQPPPEAAAEVPATDLPGALSPDLDLGALQPGPPETLDITAPADRGGDARASADDYGFSDPDFEAAFDDTDATDPTLEEYPGGYEPPVYPPEPPDGYEGDDTPEEGPRGQALRRICDRIATSEERISETVTEAVAEHPEGPARVKELVDEGLDVDEAVNTAAWLPVSETHSIHSMAEEIEISSTVMEHGQDLQDTGLEVEMGISETRLRVTDADTFAGTLEETRPSRYDESHAVEEAVRDVLEQAVVDIRIGIIGLHPEEATAHSPNLPALNEPEEWKDRPLEATYQPSVPLDVPAQAARLADQVDRLGLPGALSNSLRLMSQAAEEGALVSFAALADTRAIEPMSSVIGVHRLTKPEAWNTVFEVLDNMDLQGVRPTFTRACCESILSDIDHALNTARPNGSLDILGRSLSVEIEFEGSTLGMQVASVLYPARSRIEQILNAHR